MEPDYIQVLSSPEARKFVREHEKDDIDKLLLNPPTGSKDHIRLLVEQVISRRKAQKKLSSWYDHPQVVLPPPLSVEQASSEAAANYKKSLVTGRKLIDLTGGMGVDCMALSANFEETSYVERDATLCQLMTHNSRAFGLSIDIRHQEASDFLLSLPTDYFDITFYIDPARRDSDQKKVMLLQHCEPDVRPMIPAILDHGGTVLLKASPMLDISSVANQIAGVQQIHIVAVKNEVKEVLYLLRGADGLEASITAVNLDTDHLPFTFRRSEEAQAQPKLLTTEVLQGSFLFEPNAAVMKAGAFKVLATRFDLVKLAVNTHLYLSTEVIVEFPGRIFQILAVLDKKTMNGLQGPMHVIARNHPLNVAEIRSRYKLREGGHNYVVATRIDQQPVFLLARPLA